MVRITFFFGGNDMLEEILKSGFGQMGVRCGDAELERFRIYYEYLTEINAVMNLTAITGEEDTARLHFLDCGALLNAADLAGKSVIDVGTGAGFPGLVLKILEPDIRLTLLDSLDKRVNFLSETCKRLGFDDVKCVHARAEEAPPELRGSFDAAVSRAVARLNVLCELCLPLVRQGGVFAAMKGPDCAGELAEAGTAIRVLGGSFDRTYSYTIPDTDISHSAILIKKDGITNAKYPRRWAQIKSKPLI
jgi:16S rRNA (guanine527-N7)-methyltransferase